MSLLLYLMPLMLGVCARKSPNPNTPIISIPRGRGDLLSLSALKIYNNSCGFCYKKAKSIL